ncbi:MAG TPA: hypothetical protein VMK65_10725, partial [Longimicrobiales bacterium]|nr:hypothetical protein [Longimicrobiales bacterium]
EESPWSRTRAFVPPLRSRWEVLPPSPAAPGASPAGLLPDVHTAMLRFCAARGDIFAVLALPATHREDEALAHAAVLDARLGTGSPETGDAGGRVLSFGALYHPWTVVPAQDAGGRVRAVPPEGAMCGMLAQRALSAGAWAVAANRPAAGVVALQPKLEEDARARFFGRRVNALAPFPEGFLTWSEETLSDDPELVGIGVRRLLILLRRLALREGNRYVFQPNSGAFQRLVQRQFETLLADLFARGAFAGARPDEGYLVVAGPAVNPTESMERGRFIVELRVAPSRPLHFLTVRLVQTGAGLSVAEA